MVEPLSILLVWTFANCPYIPNNMGDSDTTYATLLADRYVVKRMLSELKSITPGVYEYMIENNMRFKFDVRFEYLDKEQSSNYPDRWCHVLYAVFEKQGEAIAFYMWYRSQDF
jgi:hypothetical protein